MGYSTYKRTKNGTMQHQLTKMFTKLTLLLLASTQLWAAPSSGNKGMHPNLPSTIKRSVKANPAETTSAYWNDNAQQWLSEKLTQQINENVAKNVILFLGDGMSVPTVSATRVYIGGEEVDLSFDKFPYTGLTKTYAVDKQVPDSANTATAFLSGIKANYGTIGVGPEVARFDCLGMTNTTNHALSVVHQSQLQNKKTGVVTTSRVTHASPAGAYAHTSNRDWESDTNVLADGEDPKVCPDIARQLVEGDTGKNLNVILGGGRAQFLPSNVIDEEGSNGDRSDGINLITEWIFSSNNSLYAWNRDQLLGLDPQIENLLGLFASDHMDYNLDRDTTMDPSLAEMTEAAITILSRGDNGYFLFVEGARIDMAHHDTEARISLDETAEFAKAVQAAVDLTDEADTLILVISDHSHTLSYSGYADRGNDILEFGGDGSDGKVYTTLSYANGPGYEMNDADGSRHDIAGDDYGADHYKFPAVVPLDSETHGGDDVVVYAQGPWSHVFSGTFEQNVIPHVIAYASCVGDGATVCAAK